MPGDALYLVAGVGLLIAVLVPLATGRISVPIVLVGVGMLVGLLPLPEGLSLDPVEVRGVIERVTEATVLVALMGVGLALDRPLSLRDRASIGGWGATWRLLLIAMPLTIGAIAVLGWGLLGLGPATALLLGAVLAPTDPVLAGDVQVEGPVVDDEDVDEEDEVRFALTSEAGLNDGLAFPFVYAAILMLTEGALASWGLKWVAWELVGKVALGVAVGWVVGWLLARLAFRAPARSLRTAENGEPLLALAAILSSYGAAELAGGYGFLAVFVCAMTMRAQERAHDYHQHMHEVVERLERLLILVVLLVLGVALTRGLLADLDWRGVLLALALVFLIRPLGALLALRLGHKEQDEVGNLDRGERLVVAFFGVRGVGSLYYLAYAAGKAPVPDLRWLWSTVAFTIVLSVIVHGILATPVMEWVERRRDGAGQDDGDGPDDERGDTQDSGQDDERDAGQDGERGDAQDSGQDDGQDEGDGRRRSDSEPAPA